MLELAGVACVPVPPRPTADGRRLFDDEDMIGIDDRQCTVFKGDDDDDACTRILIVERIAWSRSCDALPVLFITRANNNTDVED